MILEVREINQVGLRSPGFLPRGILQAAIRGRGSPAEHGDLTQGQGRQGQAFREAAGAGRCGTEFQEGASSATKELQRSAWGPFESLLNTAHGDSET